MQLKAEARELLVDSYVSLRRGDTAPGSRVAYRMTVRQLEALIRLSEAIARSHLDTQVLFVFGNSNFLFTLDIYSFFLNFGINLDKNIQVQPHYVRLAVRLLKTSIIRQVTL